MREYKQGEEAARSRGLQLQFLGLSQPKALLLRATRITVIRRRSVSVAGGWALLVAQGLSRSQPATVIRRIGYLGATQTAVGTRLREAFKTAMRELGWVEGSNIEYHFAFAAGEMDRLNALADDLISRNVDVIVTTTPQALSAAQRATKTVPIVTIGGSNSVSSGFVASLAKPGGNVTGLSFQYEDVLGKLIGIAA